MRIKDELRKAVQDMTLGEALIAEEVVAVVLDKLIARVHENYADWTYNGERWLREVKDGMR